MKLNIELYVKVDFLRTEAGLIYAYNTGTGKKHIWIVPFFSRSTDFFSLPAACYFLLPLTRRRPPTVPLAINK